MIPAAPKPDYAARIKKRSERTSTASGVDFADNLLKEFKARHPDCDKNASKWRMFSEIVMHNAFDMAGNRHIRSADGSRFSAFDAVFEGLNKRQLSEKKATGRDAWVEGVLPLLDRQQYNDGTPNGIISEKELRQHLEERWDEMQQNGFLHTQQNGLPLHFKDDFAREAFEKNFNEDPEKNFNDVLNILPSYTKGYVQTPHPTEVLSREAIDAEQDLHTELEHNLKLFNGRMHLEEHSSLNSVLSKMETLFSAIAPVLKPVDIRTEMLRSVQFSEQMFDSIPITAQAVVDAAKRHEAFNDPDNNRHLTPDQLMAFNFMIQPQTWSPGDRDSKTQMTAAMLSEGIQVNKKAMQLHYVKKLANLIADPEASDVAGNNNEIKVKQNLRQIMWNVMQDLSVLDVNSSLEESGMPPAAAAEIKSMQDARNQLIEELPRKEIEFNPKARPFHEVINALKGYGTCEAVKDGNGKLQGHPGLDVSEPRYLSGADFASDLEAMRGTPDGVNPPKFPSHVLPDGHVCNFSTLDALVMQANNFGKSALRSQIRENSEMHSKVMETTLLKLEKAGIHVPGFDKDNLETAHKREVIDAAIKLLMANNQPNGIGHKIHSILQDSLDAIAPSIEKLALDKLPADVKNDKNFKKDANFYETLQGMKIANDHPECITHYLIAECHSAEEMLETFFLLKAMEADDTRYRATDNHGNTLQKVELVPLFEYRKNVEEIPNTISEVYKNEYFAAYHNGMSATHHPSLTVANRNNSEPQDIVLKQHTILHRPLMGELGTLSTTANAVKPDAYNRLTVAQAKAMYNIPVAEGDDKREVKALKTVMMAGSDITKSSGCAGAGLVLHSTNEVRKELLTQEPPVLLVDYTGCGSGIHRSHPVGTEFETTQGRGMRQSDSNIAQKTLINLGRFILKKLGLAHEQPQTINPENQQEKLMVAQLNLGNLHGLKLSDDYWDKETGERLNAQMKHYESLYTDPGYSAYMGFTADPFVKLTSYAARAAARVGAQADVGFPPLVDVSNLRAIGYGASLNAAGSCATYFYGTGKFLHLDDNKKIPANEHEKLVDLYLHDPIAQDTINRATYGVVMAKMDTAWKYMNCKRDVAKDGTVTITNKNGAQMSTAELAQETPEIAALKKIISDNKKLEPNVQKDLTLDQKRSLAIYEMAKIDLEYEQAKHGLLELQQLAKKSIGQTPKTLQQAGILTQGLGNLDPQQRMLLAELPKTLRDQITESRQNVDPGREDLAQLFSDVVNNNVKMPKRNAETPDPEFSKIYYPMGAVFECFENIPRAYSRIRWSIAHEQQQSVGLAAA